MRAWAFIVALLGALLLVIASPRVAFAKKAEFALTKLEVPDDTTADFEKRLRRLIRSTADHLDFGKSKRVEASLRLKEFKVEVTDELVRVTATLVGRLTEGGTARSHISFGAKPSKRKSLEKQVLRIVVDSVLTRLAEMARVRDALEERKKSDPPPVTVVEPACGLPGDDHRALPGGRSRARHGAPADGHRECLA
ncbi:MAG: hypothetical protein U0414_22215 [Polyangiaceae bacterium]